MDAPLGESDNPPRFGDGGEAVYVALTNVPGTETGFAMSDEERVLFSASVCSFYYNCMYVFVYVFSGPYLVRGLDREHSPLSLFSQ